MTLNATVEELKMGLESFGFSDKNFRQSELIRLKSLNGLIDNGVLDNKLFIKRA
jgi:hypothetical protein